jgi:hypothetical protein
MQEAYPVPSGVRLRRVHGSGRTWVVEGVNDYDGDVWNLVLILDLDEDDGSFETRAIRTALSPSRMAVSVGGTHRVSDADQRRAAPGMMRYGPASYRRV